MILKVLFTTARAAIAVNKIVLAVGATVFITHSLYTFAKRRDPMPRRRKTKRIRVG